jgi:glycerol-1-phosphate dehydrogenase [NAD(P)+]
MTLGSVRGFDVHYGRGKLAEVVAGLGPWAVATQPEPWAVMAPTLPGTPEVVIEAGDLRLAHLDAVAESLIGVEAIVGLGGGSAMDTAKWLHHRTGLPLYQVPSLPSVDACFTRMTALRDGGGVRYDGDSVPELVMVDFDLIGAAPRKLVSGGIGDVLSCHTGLFDWELAARHGRNAPWDEAVAARGFEYLDELEALAPLLAAGSDEGVQRLMECHRDIGWMCHEVGHARFEEGSEHFFAYTFEEVTGRTIMHGELVTLGVLVMSAIQGNDPDRPRRIADAAGARTGLDELGVRWDEVEATLERLPSFVEEQDLWFSVANGLVVDDEVFTTARSALRV